MSFFDPKQPQFPKFNLQQALNTFHSHCSSILRETKLPNLQPAISNLQSTFSNLRFQNRPAFARIAAPETSTQPPTCLKTSEELFGGVQVYGITNSSDECIVLTGPNSEKSVVLFCIGEDDARLLQQEVKLSEPLVGQGSKIVPQSLAKVLDLKLDGVAFRLVPEPSQIKHAVEVRKKAGIVDDNGFSGVPVFQSRNLVIQTPQKSYRPVFFRKEDLEDTIAKAVVDGPRNMKMEHMQVAVLEDVLREMKLSLPESEWNDVIFIPPGLEFPTRMSKSNAKPM